MDPRTAGAVEDAAPLIVSLEFDAKSFAVLDGLRQRYFPPAINVLAAHLTLFHKLPGEEIDRVSADLRAATHEHLRIEFATSGMTPRSLGRGVAIAMPNAALSALRADLARGWGEWLTQQDRQGFRPHVTIQNKVTPTEARSLLSELETGFTPFEASGTALRLWRYRGGPWEAAGTFPFTEG